MPNPAPEPPNPSPTAPAPPVRLDDRLAMGLGSLGFGLAIPWLTGLYGPVRPHQALYWAGQLGFFALAAAIWGGNRWLLFKQREHLDWFRHPLRKLSLLVAANVLYTAPITALGLLAWFWAAGLPVDAKALQIVCLTNVICVLFVTHAYETVFLIRERESDLMRVERLQRLNTQAELAALKAQVDPHFLFNSLNTLGHLIVQDPPRGREFCDLLAEVYRYVLDSRQRDLVPLAEELDFLRRYHRLLELRFGPVLPLHVDAQLQQQGARGVVPLGLQGLLENAVKHNQASQDQPLPVRLTLRDGCVWMANPRQPRRSRLPSAGLGLRNLDERCRLLVGRALQRSSAESTQFEVGVPLAGVGA